MENLPFDILPPMRILPLWLVWGVRALMLLAVLLIIFAVMKYLVPYFKKMIAPPPPPVISVEGDGKSWDIAGSIQKLRDEYRVSGDYREGLVALSALVKSFLEWKSGKEIEEMESSEIRAALDDAAGSFFSALELAAFGIDEPAVSDLNEFCSKAEKIAAVQKRRNKGNA